MTAADWMVRWAEGLEASPRNLTLRTVLAGGEAQSRAFRFHIPQYLSRRAKDWAARGHTETLVDWPSLNARSKFWGDDQRAAFKNWEEIENLYEAPKGIADNIQHREFLRRVMMKVLLDNKLDLLIQLHTALPPGKIGLAPEPNVNNRQISYPFGPNAGITEILIPAGYVRVAYDPVFELATDANGRKFYRSRTGTTSAPSGRAVGVPRSKSQGSAPMHRRRCIIARIRRIRAVVESREPQDRGAGGTTMRLTPLVAALLTLTLSGSAFAQEWVEFTSREDGFTGNFPSQPTVTQTTYRSQYGAELPARVYSAQEGPNRYSMTVVDYSQIEKILTEKARSCPIRTEGCYGGTGFSGVGHWRLDYQGAIVYATGKFAQRDAKLTQLTWSTIYGVGGHQVHLTNRDGSRTMAAVYMHNQKLYIIEGTVPAGYPEPALFQQSFGWVDENGKEVRYQSLYHPAFPAPPRGAPPNQENPGN